MKKIRLNAFIARTGYCSRRKADTLIQEGKVAVNGSTVRELGTKIDPAKDIVTCCGKRLQLKEIYTYLLLHKPRGCITTASDERGRKTVLDLLPAELKKKRLFPVGRLDKDTTGLLLLTDDGELAHTLMHPGSQVEKTYEVGISAPFRKEHLARFTKGIRDEDDLLKAKEVRILEDRLLEVVLTEGKKREIKRMFAKLGYTLTFIKRIQYSFLSLRDLEEGKFRALSQKEVAKLKAKDGVRS